MAKKLMNGTKKKKFNDRELKLIEDIRTAESYVSSDNELEIDFYDESWHAHEYNGSESQLLDDFPINPLITEEEIEKTNVDVYAVLDYCNVFHSEL